MKKETLLCAIFPLLLLTAGCKDDRRPVDELAIAANLTIVQAENPADGIRAQIVRPVFEPHRAADALITHGAGQDLVAAMHDIQSKEVKRVVLGKLRTVFLGLSLAEAGIYPILRQIDEIADFDARAHFAVYEGQLEDIENTLLPENTRIGLVFSDTFEMAREAQLIPSTNFAEIMKVLANPGKELVLPLVHIDAEGREFHIGGLAVFRGGRMVGRLGSREVAAYFLLSEPVNMLSVDIPAEELALPEYRRLSFTVRGLRRQARVRLEDGKPVIDVRLRLTVDLAVNLPEAIEASDKYQKRPLEKEQIDQFSQAIGLYVEKITQQLVDRAQQEFHSDLFGFGKAVRAQQNRYFQSVEWSEEFPAAEVSVDAAVTIRQFEAYGL